MLSEILQRSEHMFSEMLEKITEIADIDNIGQLSENGGTSAEIAPSSAYCYTYRNQNDWRCSTGLHFQ